MSKEYNGWSLNEKDMRSRTKYLVVMRGDLDLNNAYGFKSKKELKKFLKNDGGDCGRERVEAVFKVSAIDVALERGTLPPKTKEK